MALWDLAGQERFQFMWQGFLRGSQILFVVTDSSPQNVLKTKMLLEQVESDIECFKKESRGAANIQCNINKLGFGYNRNSVKIVVIANKQDLPGSMRATQVADLLGKPTYPMVAVDPKKRVEMYWILQQMLESMNNTTVAS